MGRKRATDNGYCIRFCIGHSPVDAALFVRRFCSVVRRCIAPSCGLAADLAFIPFAVMTISMQARGERRAPRFNY